MRLVVRAYERMLRWAHQAVDGVIAIDEDCVRVNQEWRVRGEMLVLKNAVDTARFKPDSAKRASARTQMGIETESRLFVIAARLESVKRIDRALRAFALARNHRPDLDLRLAIAGTGGEAERLKSLSDHLSVRSAVSFLGNVAWKDMPSLLGAADCCVLCSEREGVPVFILEALAAGRPVVATAVGGVPSILKTGSGILISSQFSDSELSEALICGVTETWSEERLRESVSEYDSRAAVTSLDAFFLEVLGAGGQESGAADA